MGSLDIGNVAIQLLNITGISDAMQIIIDDCLFNVYGECYCEYNFPFRDAQGCVEFLKNPNLVEPECEILTSDNLSLSEAVFHSGLNSKLEFSASQDHSMNMKFTIDTNFFGSSHKMSFMNIFLEFDDFWNSEIYKITVLTDCNPLDCDRLTKEIAFNSLKY